MNAEIALATYYLIKGRSVHSISNDLFHLFINGKVLICLISRLLNVK